MSDDSIKSVSGLFTGEGQSPDQFLEFATRIRSAQFDATYRINTAASDETSFKVALLDSETWFELPVSVIASITALAPLLQDGEMTLLAGVTFKEEFQPLARTLSVLANAAQSDAAAAGVEAGRSRYGLPPGDAAASFWRDAPSDLSPVFAGPDPMNEPMGFAAMRACADYDSDDEPDAANRPIPEAPPLLDEFGSLLSEEMPPATRDMFTVRSRSVTTVDNNITHIYPTFQQKVLSVIALANQYSRTPQGAAKFPNFARWGLFEGYRSQARQEWLYAQGRTRPGPIVTYKRTAGWHGRGLAADVVWYDVSGRPRWDGAAAMWSTLGHCARYYGCEWGGDWPRFRDLPHVQASAADRAALQTAAMQWIASQTWA